MKKLIMFVMVLMLCLGTVAKAAEQCVIEEEGRALTIDPAGAGVGQTVVLRLYRDGEWVEDLWHLNLWESRSTDWDEPPHEWTIEENDISAEDGFHVEYDFYGEWKSSEFIFEDDTRGFVTFGDVLEYGGIGACTCGSIIIPSLAIVDANDIYEPEDDPGPPLEGPTADKLLVSLSWQPPTLSNVVTVILDPNTEGDGPHEDFVFPAAAGDGTVTLIFDKDDWDVQREVAVEAVQDLVREGDVSYDVLFTYSDTTGDPNFNSDPEEPVTSSVTVVDNDVPVIVVVDPCDALNGTLSENDPNGEACFTVELSHVPEADVHVIVSRYSDYDILLDSMSEMVPPLGQADDPNKLIFTSGNWDDPQEICIEANDDDELAEEWSDWIGGTIRLEGFSDDTRYQSIDEDGELEVKEVDFEVEDNECGAWGWAELDTNEDCIVDIEELLEFATRWLLCSDPQDPACESYL